MIRNTLDSQLFGRELDLSRVWSLLGTQSLLLQGARRVGKTALLKHMAALPRDGWRAVRIDLEGVSDVAGGVARVLEALGVEAKPSWTRLELALAAALTEDRLVLLLDEVPWWLDEIREREGDDAARQALERLRGLREREPDLRMILTGSIGLAGLAIELHASAALNDLFPVPLAPLSEAASGALVAAVAKTLDLEVDEGVAQILWSATGGSPHWMQVLLQRLSQHERATPSTAEAAIAQLLGERQSVFDAELRGHLVQRHGAQLATQLRALLSAVANTEGAEPHTLITEALAAGASNRPGAERLLYTLVDEHYLQLDAEGRYVFQNRLLRDWLRKNPSAA